MEKLDGIAVRDRLLEAAVDYTSGMKGKKRDMALFDYLCGAVKALTEFGGDYSQGEVPAWLWVIGVRGGDRLREIERMLHGEPEAEKKDAEK